MLFILASSQLLLDLARTSPILGAPEQLPIFLTRQTAAKR